MAGRVQRPWTPVQMPQAMSIEGRWAAVQSVGLYLLEVGLPVRYIYYSQQDHALLFVTISLLDVNRLSRLAARYGTRSSHVAAFEHAAHLQPLRPALLDWPAPPPPPTKLWARHPTQEPTNIYRLVDTPTGEYAGLLSRWGWHVLSLPIRSTLLSYVTTTYRVAYLLRTLGVTCVPAQGYPHVQTLPTPAGRATATG